MSDADKPLPVSLSRRRGRPAAGEDIQQALLDAAALVYADCGFHGTTVEKVLQASGVSRPTFYRYYRDKDELLTAVVATTNARLVQTMFERLLPIEDRIAQVEEAINVYMEWGLSVGRLARVLWGEIHMPESPVGRDRERLIALMLDFFQAQAVRFGRPPADRVVYEGLIAVLESVASKVFIRGDASAAELALRKAVIQRIFMATLAMPEEIELLPPLPLRPA